MPTATSPSNSAKDFLWHYIKPHRWRMAALFLVMILVISLGILAPVLAARFIDEVIAGGPESGLVRLAILTLLIALAAQVLSMVETGLAEDIGWRTTNRLRLDLLDHLLGLDAQFHANHPSGELISRVDGDVGTLSNVFSRFTVSILGNGIMVLAILGVVLWTDLWIGVVLTIFVLVTSAILAYTQRIAQPRWEANQQMVGEYTGLIGEYISGAEDIRTSGAVPWAMRNHALLLRRWLPIRIRSEMVGYAMGASTTGAFAIALLLSVVIAIFRVESGSLTIGAVFLLSRLIMMMNEPIGRLRNELQELQQASAGFLRVRDLLAIQSGIDEHGSSDLPRDGLTLEFRNVTFGYDSDQPVLKGVSFTVPAGNVLGIVGRTGSGKTSITRLIPRLYDANGGTVVIGGCDVRELDLESLRTRIGVVTQDVHLLYGTLRDNLTLFDHSIPDPRILEAIHLMGIGTWLQTQPLGLNTIVGSDGANLSAGEAQLITCVRALLRDPDLVILDEASARLDPATDRLLHNALRTLLQNRTAVLVAHRMSTLSFADQIVVLEDGVVVESGPRQHLADDPTSHFSTLMRQSHEEDLA